MPPLPLANLLQSALSEVSRPSRALLSSLACINGNSLPADDVAAWVGLRNRYQLNRVLRRDGLPPLAELTACVRVLYWKHRAEETGESLCKLARRDHVDPAVAYRVVRRVTGKRWSQLRPDDLGTILSRLRERLRPHSARSSGRTQRTTGALSLRPPTRSSAPPAPSHPVGVLAARLTVPDPGLDDVAVTGARVALLARPRAAAIEVVDLSTLKSLGTIPTAPNPTRIAVSHSGERAYVTAQFGEEVSIIDLRFGRQIGAISFAGCGHPLGTALGRDERTLYVSTNLDRLYRIDVSMPDRLTWSALPNASQHLAVHPQEDRIVANGWRSGVVTECHASALRVSRTFALGGCVQQATFSPSGDRLFVANLAGWLDVVSFSTGLCEARVDFGTAAFGVTLSRDARVLVVSLLDAGAVALVDVATLRTLARVKTGGRPRIIATDPGGAGVVVANENGWLDLVN